MQWEGRRESENVQDQRGQGVGGGTGLMLGGGAGSILLLILALVFGGDIFKGASPRVSPKDPERDDKQLRFVKVVLADTEDVWTRQFAGRDKPYRKPELIVFEGQVQTGCGLADSSIGPFYCPGDEKVYIDLGFFLEMEDKLGAPGDFAQAYVIAHEVGHHVQKLTGRTDYVDSQRRKLSKREYNKLSVRLELQADFYAGVWAHHMKKHLEPGDVEEAINAAKAVGDDYLQKKHSGRVVPEHFTHGTSTQRSKWFMAGFKSGKMQDGDVIFKLPYEEL